MCQKSPVQYVSAVSSLAGRVMSHRHIIAIFRRGFGCMSHIANQIHHQSPIKQEIYTHCTTVSLPKNGDHLTSPPFNQLKMKNIVILMLALMASCLASYGLAFLPSSGVVCYHRESRISTSTISIAAIPVDIAHVKIQESFSVPMTMQQQSMINDGVCSYAQSLPSALEESSTVTLSLKERPPPPTKEELEAKKRNFNLCG
jgi:hypothetical protein